MLPPRLPRHPCLPGALLALLGLAHPWLEASMAWHMLAELPLLFALGWHAAALASRARLRPADAAGGATDR
jgi:hypothetical protein